MGSLEQTDALGAKGATHPRVSLADIDAAIESIYFVNAGKALGGSTPARENLHILTLCFVVMKNGFIVVGKSAPASPENYDEAKGKTFAREDAMRQLWPLMAFSLRDQLAT
ncbi:MAG: Gp49 family protein [Pseudomonadota bacterium]